MTEDTELLRRYAEEKSETAFAELVQRRVNFVYAAAFRRVGGDAHLAEDVTQQVFTALARGAASLTQHPVLSGWLYTTTRNAATQVVRSERRRQTREQEVHIMNEITSSPARDADWERLRPVLDGAMDALNETDREAVLLRFFEGKSFAGVAAKLQLTENTARMRVERALDKLHGQLARRGVTSTTAALSVALANQAALAAPAGLAASVTGAALAGGAAAVASAGVWSTFMSIGKLQIGIASALAVAGSTGLMIQARATTELRDELAGLNRQKQSASVLTLENRQLASVASEAESARAQSTELSRLQGELTALRGRLSAARSIFPEPARKLAVTFTGPFFESNQVDEQPKPSYKATPAYPFELRKGGFTGEATVDFIVDAQGNVHNATVVTATQPAFGESAIAAVSKWQFDPALKNGQPVAARHQLPIVFTLDDGTKPATKPANSSPNPNPRRSAPLLWF